MPFGSCDLDWHVAVYAVNEAHRIEVCLRSIAASLVGRRFLITVVVNGSNDRSAEIAAAVAQSGVPMEVHRIRYRDKANAINQFLHTLRRPARFVGQVDAYAIVGPRAFEAMEAKFAQLDEIQAVTGIAITGRTMPGLAELALRGGVLGGQLHAFRPAFLDRMTGSGTRLPIGLYRGDGLLGSMAAHDLRPLSEPWRNDRVAGVADATFDIPVLSPFRLRDLKRQYRREIRQARGTLENAAIKRIIYQGGYEALPTFADDMLAEFVEAGAVPPTSGRTAYFRKLALKEVALFRAPEPASLLPSRLA